MTVELWVEKYRPRTLDEMVDQEEIVRRLKEFVEDRNVPHLLFVGPPGTGKTTAALCLAHDLYGERWRDNTLELNASVTPDTPILVRVMGVVRRITFQELDAMVFGGDEDAEYAVPYGLEVLSMDTDTYKVRFKLVSAVARHRVSRIVRIKYEGGEVKTTPDHSVMVLDDDGHIVSKRADEIKPGDFLVSFKSALETGVSYRVPVNAYVDRENPKVRRVFDYLEVNGDVAWLLGLYSAEGAVGFRNGTSGQIIFTLGYPQEMRVAERVIGIARELGVGVHTNLTPSGFNRSRLSAIQVRMLNTQLARFIASRFYAGARKIASEKIVPDFVFNLPVDSRIAFLKGYMGDASGEWGGVVRYSSVSGRLLIDVAWLARISGIESSVFENEARLIWRGGMKWCKSDLLPAEPFIKFFEEVSEHININWRYELRHALYEGKSRVSKATLLKVLESVDVDALDDDLQSKYYRLRRLASSDIYVVKVKSVESENYDGWVYDVGVPGAEVFWGGTTPILLHNSDERGIDVIRTRIKEYARTIPLGEVPFKLIILDEADNMTGDAQQALRRTMELFSRTTRFILIANYASKIIEPIQSRCAIFRFQPLPREAAIDRLKYIASQEGLKVEEEAYEAIWEESEGDLRKAINILQATAALDEVVTEETVYKVLGKVAPTEVREMLKLALAGDFLKAREKLRHFMLSYGLSGVDVLKLIHREILSPRSELKLDERTRAELIDLIGEINFRLVEGADDEIQLNALLARLALIGSRAG